VGTFFLFIVTVHSILLLVRSRQSINETEQEAAQQENRPAKLVASYGDVGSFVYGRVGTAAIDVMLFFTQGGFCVAYLVR